MLGDMKIIVSRISYASLSTSLLFLFSSFTYLSFKALPVFFRRHQFIARHIIKRNDYESSQIQHSHPSLPLKSSTTTLSSILSHRRFQSTKLLRYFFPRAIPVDNSSFSLIVTQSFIMLSKTNPFRHPSALLRQRNII